MANAPGPQVQRDYASGWFSVYCNLAGCQKAIGKPTRFEHTAKRTAERHAESHRRRIKKRAY